MRVPTAFTIEPVPVELLFATVESSARIVMIPVACIFAPIFTPVPA